MDFLKLIAAVRKLAADVRAQAGVMAILDDAIAVFQLIRGSGVVPTPDPAPPALTAHFGAGAKVSAAAVADQLDQFADEHEAQAAKVGAGEVGRAFDGDILKKLWPVVLQALIAAFTGA